jgi:hypothetical protein
MTRCIAALAVAGLLASATSRADSAPQAPSPPQVPAQSASPIDPAQLSATVKTLASDAYQGRAPGSPGEAVTVDYLIDRFKSLGLQPGGEHGGWIQQVPLVHNVAGSPALLELRLGARALPLVVGRDINPQTVRATSRVQIAAAPMVFVGYGVAAPERGWDDFKGSICTARWPSFWSTIRISRRGLTRRWRGNSAGGR